jgi:hypothetical protein
MDENICKMSNFSKTMSLVLMSPQKKVDVNTFQIFQ